MRYQDAGVDIARADDLKEAIGRAVRSTWSDRVRPLAGGFAGLMDMPGADGTQIAVTMDGVGTKLHLAMQAGRIDDAAADLVYHCADDLLAHGARPFAFLDYVAQARLEPSVLLGVVEGLSRACREVGAVLLGGETAEMPDTYLDEVVDVAGCMLGTVPANRVVDGSRVQPGDRLLGLASEGLHTNGYSLARKVLAASGLGLDGALPGGSGETAVDALLAPHRWYGKSVLPLVDAGDVRAIAHITGGGIAGNLVRVIPENVSAQIDPKAWSRPPVFRWLCKAGEVPESDARQAFNLGIGLIVVCTADREADVRTRLEQSQAKRFTRSAKSWPARAR